MNTDYLAERSKAREKDMASKFSDEVIRQHIVQAAAVCEDDMANIAIAQAMIAYNRMIDDRWAR